MGTAAAVASAVAALIGLVMYFYKRHDSPAAVRQRAEGARRDEEENFDRVLGEANAEDITRMFSDIDDMAEPCRLRGKGGDSPGGPGDKAAP